MRVLDLFSGVGGGALGLERAGAQIAEAIGRAIMKEGEAMRSWQDVHNRDT